jgi:hypothetical protein
MTSKQKELMAYAEKSKLTKITKMFTPTKQSTNKSPPSAPRSARGIVIVKHKIKRRAQSLSQKKKKRAAK